MMTTPTLAGIPLSALANPPTPAELGAFIGRMPFERQAEFLVEWRQTLMLCRHGSVSVSALGTAILEHDGMIGDEYAAGFIDDIHAALSGGNKRRGAA